MNNEQATSQATLIREELSTFVRQKLDQGIPMSIISIGLNEMGCATAFMMGLTAQSFLPMLPRLMERGQEIVTGVRKRIGRLQ